MCRINMVLTVAILLGGLVCLPLSLSAQTSPSVADIYRFERITKEDGLSNHGVSRIVQDSYGFLWFATQGGLNKYDGKTFTTFRYDPYNENSLPTDMIQTLFLAPDDILWIGTYRGLSRFDIKRKTFSNYAHDPADEGNPEALPSPFTMTLYEEQPGSLWVGTWGGGDKPFSY